MRAYVTASVFIILGLTALLVRNWLGPAHPLFNYVDQLPGVFLVSGVLGFTYKLVEQRDADRKLNNLFNIHESIAAAGLDEIRPESQSYSFSELLDESRTLTVVLNDAQRWTGNNSVKLQERFGRPDTETEVFTIDPQGAFAKALAAKLGLTVSQLQTKVDTARKTLIDAHKAAGRKGRLTILALRHFPTHSIFFSERYAVLTPYQTAAGRANVPVLIFRKRERSTNVYAFVASDVEQIRKESSPVYPPPQGTATTETKNSPIEHA